MAIKGSARGRTALVAVAAVVTVVTATSMAGAHEGNDGADSIHACVAGNGLLRVLSDPAQACRSNETALHWTVGNEDSGELEEFRNELLAMDNVSDLVDWSNLAHVPVWLQDGVVDFADIRSGSLPVWLQDGVVDFADIRSGSLPVWLQDGDVDYTDLVGALDLPDGSVNAFDLAGEYGFNGSEATIGAVTSEKIADGTVEERDLAARAVTPSVTVAIVQSGTGASSGTTPASSTAATVAVPTGGLVMVSGQAQLVLPIPCASCRATVTYEVLRGGTVVSPAYEVDLSGTHERDVASIAWLDSSPPDGDQAYELRITSSGDTVTVTDVVLTAHVLGHR